MSEAGVPSPRCCGKKQQRARCPTATHGSTSPKPLSSCQALRSKSARYVILLQAATWRLRTQDGRSIRRSPTTDAASGAS
eukprot:1317465-Pleurochrysis_carterae.AAC.1